MNGKDFKAAMKNPSNIYCLVSTDAAMIDLYVDRFKTAINAKQVSYGQIKPYGKLFKKKTLNVIYMPKLTEEIFSRHEYIFIYTETIDKRSAIYKKYKDRIIELKNNYIDYIIKHTSMTESEAKDLAKKCNDDLGLIRNAITLYNDSNKEYNIFTDYSNDIYGWIDSFIKKENLPRCTESPISIMALLSTNCQNILRVKQKDIANMNPYIVKCSNDLASYITENELIQIINDCFYLDSQIKKGLIDINYCIPYLKLRRYS